MEYIKNKLRRYTTFSKRKSNIMKKAYELSTLTGTQVSRACTGIICRQSEYGTTLTNEDQNRNWIIILLPYGWKNWRGIKFGSLVVCLYNRQIKIRQYFLLAYIRMAIPYRTAKFKSAKYFCNGDFGPNRQIWFPPIFLAIQYIDTYMDDTLYLIGTCTPIFTINHEIFIVKIVSDGMGNAKINHIKKLCSLLALMWYRIVYPKIF